MYKDKEVNNVNNFFVNVWRKNIFDIYVTEYGTALTTILPILFLYLNTVTVFWQTNICLLALKNIIIDMGRISLFQYD
jgi:hypothetical protein